MPPINEESKPSLTPRATGLPQQSLAYFSRRAFGKSLFAIIEWLAHCFVVTFILLGMKGLELLSSLLWSGDRHFFGQSVTIHELFATADFVLLAVILVLGVGCVIKAYWSQ